MKSEFENEIWEACLKKAVIEHSLQEIDDYSPSEIAKTELPPHYVTSMKKFVRQYQYRTRFKAFARSARKVASIAFILMGISFSLLLQFDEVRAACQTILTTIYERYIEFFYKSPNDAEAKLPDIVFLPEGFYLEEYSVTDTSQVFTYVNDSGEEILLTCFSNNHTLQIDTEHYKSENVHINHLDGKFFSSFDSKFKNILVWNSEDTYYMLSSHLDRETLLEIAKNIK